MGAKTHEDYDQKPDGNAAAQKAVNQVKKPRNGAFPDDDLGGSDEDGDGDGKDTNDDEADELNASLVDNHGNKKKKRKRSKKKTKNMDPAELKQSSPPRIVLSSIFPNGDYPVGEMSDYDHNLARITGEELRANDRMDDQFLSDYRQAAETHRQVRQYAQTIIKPGKGLTEIADVFEDGVRALLGNQGLEPGDGLKAGFGFPTGLCLNHGTAHYTPNPSQKDVILKYDDVLKVDFGVHVNGRIVDSAFTMAFDPVYENLIQSVRDATNTGVKVAGIDARMSEIGAAVQEAMESYEVEIKGRTYPIKAVRNITGHNIEQYRIHGGKSVPFIKNSSRQKMEEGEVYAIETFGSTGRAIMIDDIGIYGYGRNHDVSAAHLHHPKAKALLKTIEENFGTLVFCRRYLERLGVKNYLPAMRILVSHGIIEEYKPLCDVKGSFTAQFEHTILLRSSGKEVISRGDDY